MLGLGLLAAQLVPQVVGGITGLIGNIFNMIGGAKNVPQNNFQGNDQAQQAQTQKFLDLLEKLVKQGEQKNQAALGNMTNGCCSKDSGVGVNLPENGLIVRPGDTLKVWNGKGVETIGQYAGDKALLAPEVAPGIIDLSKKPITLNWH